LFGGERFALEEFALERGEALVIYSDGVSEATDKSGNEYGAERLRELIGGKGSVNASAILAACRDDLGEFRRNAAKTDDVTLFILSRG
jgi:sigma-B regulation protein RsbU (phosphoserine phosphatase)